MYAACILLMGSFAHTAPSDPSALVKLPTPEITKARPWFQVLLNSGVRMKVISKGNSEISWVQKQ